MKFTSLLGVTVGAAAAVMAIVSCATSPSDKPQPTQAKTVADAQVPTWSADDRAFFLHGTMSTEFAPEPVLRAFIKIYPDLFPDPTLANLGIIPDQTFGWPVGFSKREVPHLAGLSSVGVNCASCHVAELRPLSGGEPVRVFGVTSHFDAEAFFGAVIVATFRTSDPKNMRAFLEAYLDERDPQPDEMKLKLRRVAFDTLWDAQASQITAAIAEDPTGSKGAGPGGLHAIQPASVRFDGTMFATGADLAALSKSMLRLFHNMRAALHVPDQPPEKAPPSSGPGRNDAFGLLSYILFNTPQPYSPVKYGVVWNLRNRRWVHWDGNTQSPLGRNVLASLGLGAPLIGNEGKFDFAMVNRQTEISEDIRAPRYPWAIDSALAKRGASHYQTLCASCHDTPEGDARLYAVDEIGTDPNRARGFTPEQASLFNHFLGTLESPGFAPPKEPGLRSTQKYWAASLAGVWARAPYLHNGSVRTMADLLTAPAQRPPTFQRGSHVYDADQMGYVSDGAYRFDTRTPGNSNAGHDYGSNLSAEQKRELIEYLKTL